MGWLLMSPKFGIGTNPHAMDRIATACRTVWEYYHGYKPADPYVVHIVTLAALRQELLRPEGTIAGRPWCRFVRPSGRLSDLGWCCWFRGYTIYRSSQFLRHTHARSVDNRTKRSPILSAGLVARQYVFTTRLSGGGCAGKPRAGQRGLHCPSTSSRWCRLLPGDPLRCCGISIP